MPSSPKYTALSGGRSALNVDAILIDGSPISSSTGLRSVWTPGLIKTSTTLPSAIAMIPWAPSDNPNATESALHVRAVMYTNDAGVASTLTVASLNTGQNLTIYSPSNLLSTNSTTPVVLESNVDLFSSPTNVFDPTVADLLIVNLAASGDATVLCRFVELILISDH